MELCWYWQFVKKQPILPKNFAIKYFPGIEKAKAAKKGQKSQKAQQTNCWPSNSKL
jgi:hypothetical protein